MTQSACPPILVSIVSHGHGPYLGPLLDDLAQAGNAELIQVVLTLNVPEALGLEPERYPYPLVIRRNPRPQGFSDNHNRVFREHARGATAYCVLNPDVRLPANTLARLFTRLRSTPDCGLVAPAVYDPHGRLEASGRPLPSPSELLRKAVRLMLRRTATAPDSIVQPDWVAGMFMLFSSEAYARIGGFDEAYFLYYEDVDICCRLRLAGLNLLYCPDISITHSAQRRSHRDLRHLGWHLQGLLRFFFSPYYRQYCLKYGQADGSL